ncbi:MAG TPA: HEPN domain-containing protein [Geobacteraceae bacterium]|nr:HEPN domain-containing protein [Geobacteraceae bacterium]
MTDQQTLFRYRLAEAEETLSDARVLLETGRSARSVVNRAYYAMFYGVLALLIAEEVEHRTSKHSGIIAIFDKAFVHTGKLGPDYSRLLHRMFDARQECDYKEFAQVTKDAAAQAIEHAETFLLGIKGLLAGKGSD